MLLREYYPFVFQVRQLELRHLRHDRQLPVKPLFDQQDLLHFIFPLLFLHHYYRCLRGRKDRVVAEAAGLT